MGKIRKFFYRLSLASLPFFLSCHLVKLMKEIEYQNILISRSLILDDNRQLEDIYYTLDTQTICLSEEAMHAISQISSSTIDSQYIDLLGIDLETAQDAYANFVDFDISCHSFSKLYDEATDDIKWELVPSTILYNSYRYNNLRRSSCSQFSSSEIISKVETMRQVVEKVKQDFPYYDMKSFACNLEKCTITKEILEDTTIAEVSSPHIFYNVEKEADILVDAHEDLHYAILTCKDIQNEKAFSRVSNGINVSTMPYCAPDKYRSGFHISFRYLF